MLLSVVLRFINTVIIQSLRAFRRARDSQEVSRVDDSTLGIEAALNNEDEEC